jgi:hypothetical protein
MSNAIFLTPEEQVGLRLNLDERYQNLSDRELYDLVSSRLSRLTPEQAEGFWSNLWKGVKTAVNVGRQVLPAVLPFTGPWGAAASGLLRLLPGSKPPQAPPPQTLPRPSGVPQPVNNTPAAAQLLQLIQDPRLLQSLISLIMGPSGKQKIPIGASPSAPQVAPSDIVSLLGVLAGKATKEAAEAYAANSTEAAIHESTGEFDPANEQQRAENLLSLLQREEQSFRTPSDPFQEFISGLGSGNSVTIELST